MPLLREYNALNKKYENCYSIMQRSFANPMLLSALNKLQAVYKKKVTDPLQTIEKEISSSIPEGSTAEGLLRLEKACSEILGNFLHNFE